MPNDSCCFIGKSNLTVETRSERPSSALLRLGSVGWINQVCGVRARIIPPLRVSACFVAGRYRSFAFMSGGQGRRAVSRIAIQWRCRTLRGRSFKAGPCFQLELRSNSTSTIYAVVASGPEAALAHFLGLGCFTAFARWYQRASHKPSQARKADVREPFSNVAASVVIALELDHAEILALAGEMVAKNLPATRPSQATVDRTWVGTTVRFRPFSERARGCVARLLRPQWLGQVAPAKRSILKSSSGVSQRPVVISSAMASPTPGPS